VAKRKGKGYVLSLDLTKAQMRAARARA